MDSGDFILRILNELQLDQRELKLERESMDITPVVASIGPEGIEMMPAEYLTEEAALQLDQRELK